MKKTVKKREIDVTVNFKEDKDSSDEDSNSFKMGLKNFPDEATLATKYGLVSLKTENQGDLKDLCESLQREKESLLNSQQSLLIKVETKNKKIESLCVLLEALEPIPGVNANKYRQLIENDNSTEGDVVDFRDSKVQPIIVSK